MVFAILVTTGLVVIVEIVFLLFPRWAPIVLICTSAGGALAILFGERIKSKIKEIRAAVPFRKEKTAVYKE